MNTPNIYKIVESANNTVQFHIYSEYDQLQSIIIGTADNFIEGERINEAMRRYYGTSQGPNKLKIEKEYKELEQILKAHNVKVLIPTLSKTASQQLAPRDIGFVIGNTFVISNMTWQSRKDEIESIRGILSNFNGKIINTPKEVLLEGGNIVIDKNTIFVGIGLRTSGNAIQFLEKQFREKYTICPVLLNITEEIIHLDSVFNLIGGNHAIIYKKGLNTIPSILQKYKLIEITKQEKDNGACNVLSINPRSIILRNNLKRIANLLRLKGFEVFVVNWNETKKTGTVGPRCATLPLIRNSI